MIVFASTLLATAVCTALLWGWFLGLGLRWSRVAGVTTRGLVGTTVLHIGLQLTLLVVAALVVQLVGQRASLLGLVEIAAAILLPCWLVMWAFRASFFQALKAIGLAMLGSSAIMVACSILLIRPFLFEAYICPTNSMAPTLLGNHWQLVCEECGSPAYCTPQADFGFGGYPDFAAICRDHFHIRSYSERGSEVLRGDRFLVAKYLRPRRWDLIVFRYPEDPSQKYVMRLIGLPGEVITLEEGQVLVDGQRLIPPDALRGIEYRADEIGPEFPWGTLAAPAQLDADEHFVLGDFSTNAKDSRWWLKGAPGHHPYAVPSSYVEGVVTQIYWPLGRWRGLRQAPGR